MRTTVKYHVTYRHREKYAISEMCRIFEVSRSGYYDFVKRMAVPAKDLLLAEKIEECQQKCGKTYGYRRVHKYILCHIYTNASIDLHKKIDFCLIAIIYFFIKN